MIDYQLKRCCAKCLFLDLDYDQHRLEFDLRGPYMLETVIFCKHAKVCEQYRNQTPGKYMWISDSEKGEDDE